MNIETVNVTAFEDYAGHEKVLRCEDKESGLVAFIAVHNRNLGPALGGCRMWPYASEDDAIKDVLRLSRGMTYKSAMAGLPLGGGKSVIMGNPKTDKNPLLLLAMGRFIHSLEGQYIGAEDSGINVADVVMMAQETPFVAGMHEKKTASGESRSGDPSPATAYGVFVGIKAALQHRFESNSLSGVKIAIQGVGNVGRNLLGLLHEAGAELYIADAWQPAIDLALDVANAHVVDNDKIHKMPVEVYAPCALGGALNMNSLVELQAPIVAGAANNQIANGHAADYLFHKGIVYAPDYVINAGGIIDIYYERNGYDHSAVIKHIDGIYATLLQLLDAAKVEGIPTYQMADKMAEARFNGQDDATQAIVSR